MGFNSDEISKLDEKIGSIDQKYQFIESDYERQEIEEMKRFNDAVKAAGVDPNSARVLAHKADDAAHKITTKEMPGTQMSARTVDRNTFTRYSNEILYNGLEETEESRRFKR